MRLTSHGAAEQVTGSCHLLEIGGHKLLVDCGMFQGRRENEEENHEPFGFDPAEIDCVLLTHAHLDHCGRLPLLVKGGFRGEIISTSATRELARLVMLDAAHIAEEEAEQRARKLRRRGQEVPGPLFAITDAMDAVGAFGRGVEYGKTIEVVPGVEATFHDAGHILGSASIAVRSTGPAGERSILFSGDLGSPGRAVLNDPAPPHGCDYIVTETTYGDRDHRPLQESVEELYAAVNGTLENGGNLVIPTFALERAQEILYYLRIGMEQKRLPPRLHVFLDSPMAITATKIFRRHPECLRESFRKELAGHEPFAFPGLKFSRTVADSQAINRIEEGAVILAGSGMCTGGRVRHHLKHNLWRKECGIAFVGYAAAGTLARIIIDGAKEVTLFGEPVAVKAKTWTINGFSAHAGHTELLEWLDACGKPRETFLVHGEPDRGMTALETSLHEKGWDTKRPEPHQPIELE
ncbi:MAG: MBL fold metallo-hydrolase [Gammaproteobacteria bacterium]